MILIIWPLWLWDLSMGWWTKMALGILTGLVSGASKLLGGKKKSGAKMGSAIVKRDPNQGAVEKKQTDIKVKTKVVSVASLLNTKSLEPASKEQSK